MELPFHLTQVPSRRLFASLRSSAAAHSTIASPLAVVRGDPHLVAFALKSPATITFLLWHLFTPGQFL